MPRRILRLVSRTPAALDELLVAPYPGRCPGLGLANAFGVAVLGVLAQAQYDWESWCQMPVRQRGLACPPLTAGLLTHFLNRRAVAGVDRFNQFLPIGAQPALQDAHATVPAQDRIVVSARPNLLSLFKVGERFFEQWRDCMR